MAGFCVSGRLARPVIRRAFLGWVHDVVWSSGGFVPISPALSVHAYAPPLTAMSPRSDGAKHVARRKRTDLTEHPEGMSRIDAMLSTAFAWLNRLRPGTSR